MSSCALNSRMPSSTYETRNQLFYPRKLYTVVQIGVVQIFDHKQNYFLTDSSTGPYPEI